MPRAKTVTVKAYKLKRGKWVAYKRFPATNHDYKSYTRYKVRLKINRKGTYRFRAVTSTNAEWTATRSSYSRTLKVK